ncbi:DUF6787 family protein [Flagellimonas sp. DF-77]|uniref:DUF6787 family protein n=1 Tax=Flagellimonas algarum TaxID=3230298 RepID=UPI003395E740
MERLKKRWEIQKNWQLVFPILGALLLLGTAYMIARRLLHLFEWNNTPYEWPFTIAITLLGYWMAQRFFLWCFKKLEHKWVVSHKWEMIVIFIVFAITGSISARLAQPLTNLIGLNPETTNGWLYWPIRIFIILPIYQILLVCFGWLFGQFSFFWAFEKKMLKRMGLGFLFR